ncbi:hypothetical protein L5876_00780 [Hyphobacterium sp. SN044]|uniref:hypothetical protein n=1 Tax=Hyphobacterium sp. SN044 TaxID=2912575 RepID=UPI001F325932|nr:hypothetical protein [Hyphobacterium sp. SN044]MCF8878347.1 hypothetical protein [Hyphobacterium sp. SN044]
MRPVFVSAIASVFLMACGNSAATDPAEAEAADAASTDQHADGEADAAAVDQHAADETGASEQGAANSQVFAAETELFGYYLPDTDVGIGDIRLDHIAIGMDWEFEEFFAGQPENYQPFVMAFDDVSSPTGIGELGNTYYEVSYAVFPENFLITDEALTFSGTHEVIGAYSFEGTFNAQQVEAFHEGLPAEGALTGTLRIGDDVFENVSFQGWLGD